MGLTKTTSIASLNLPSGLSKVHQLLGNIICSHFFVRRVLVDFIDAPPGVMMEGVSSKHNDMPLGYLVHHYNRVSYPSNKRRDHRMTFILNPQEGRNVRSGSNSVSRMTGSQRLFIYKLRLLRHKTLYSVWVVMIFRAFCTTKLTIDRRAGSNTGEGFKIVIRNYRHWNQYQWKEMRASTSNGTACCKHTRLYAWHAIMQGIRFSFSAHISSRSLESFWGASCN